jgi:hypothetical protein
VLAWAVEKRPACLLSLELIMCSRCCSAVCMSGYLQVLLSAYGYLICMWYSWMLYHGSGVSHASRRCIVTSRILNISNTHFPILLYSAWRALSELPDTLSFISFSFPRLHFLHLFYFKLTQGVTGGRSYGVQCIGSRKGHGDSHLSHIVHNVKTVQHL